MQMTVPLYSCEQEFQGYIPERYALKLERNGVAKLVRHQKGSINRVGPSSPTGRSEAHYAAPPYG
jgi:hypothetical protein